MSETTQKTAPSSLNNADLKRVVRSSAIGTSLEWYDYYVFGTASALVFGHLFFPAGDALVSTMLSFLVWGLGILVRPLGGLVAGHYGDKHGRKNILIITLITMGVASVLIGLLPTYAQIGLAAPLLLIALRIVQGLAVGGEWGGAVLMVVEHADDKRRGGLAAWVQFGVPVGNLTATGLFLALAAVLSNEDFLAWGWRVPFLLSAVIVAVGIYMRLKVTESPQFARLQESGERAKLPLWEVIRTQPWAIVRAVGLCIGSQATYYTFALYSLTYVTEVLGQNRNIVLTAVLIGSALQLFLYPFCGALSDRIGRRRTYAIGVVGTMAWVLVFFPLLNTKSVALIVVGIAGGMVFQSFLYGPMAAWIAELFGTRVRFSGVSISYQLGAVLGSSLTPLIATYLLSTTGSIWPFAVYMTVALLVTGVAVMFTRETAGRSIESD